MMKKEKSLGVLLLSFMLCACGGHFKQRQALYGGAKAPQNTPDVLEDFPEELHDPAHRERLGKAPLNGEGERKELAETVSVMEVMRERGEQLLHAPRGGASTESGAVSDAQSTESKIALLREIEGKIAARHFKEAQEKAREMEKDTVPQFRVRAKYLRGEVFFHQGEYDIAKQVYEEILRNDAFSGIVLKALERLVTCSEKLNQESERKKYRSILYDFFGKT